MPAGTLVFSPAQLPSKIVLSRPVAPSKLTLISRMLVSRAPCRSAFAKEVPFRIALLNWASRRMAPSKIAPVRLAPEKSVPDARAREKSVPVAFATPRRAPVRCVSESEAPERFTLSRLARSKRELWSHQALHGGNQCPSPSRPKGRYSGRAFRAGKRPTRWPWDSARQRYLRRTCYVREGRSLRMSHHRRGPKRRASTLTARLPRRTRPRKQQVPE